jgi:hypothetical protein
MKKLAFYIILSYFSIAAFGQEKITLNGYLNDMQSAYNVEPVGWLWQNQLHNRLNLNIYATNWLRISVQGRTRIIIGDSLSVYDGYGKAMSKDKGLFDLTYAKGGDLTDGSRFAFSSMIDRAWAEFTFGDFVATVGRQRINWGQTFAWNPNDIFNSYSYFDVDYPERPGSDAIRLQYYTGMASNIEVAAKIDANDKITAAGYYRFNALGYDVQLIGGILSEEDLVLGTGWSGNILNTSFRGELSYFKDLDNFIDTTGNIMLSVGSDYTFASSLWIQGEVLYSGFAKDVNSFNLLQLMGSDINIKNLGFSEWSIFSSISYPITPLINASLAGMYFPGLKGFYIGPSFDFSLSDNLAASLIIQEFSMEQENFAGSLERNNIFIGYARIKWSF